MSKLSKAELVTVVHSAAALARGVIYAYLHPTDSKRNVSLTSDLQSKAEIHRHHVDVTHRFTVSNDDLEKYTSNEILAHRTLAIDTGATTLLRDLHAKMKTKASPTIVGKVVPLSKESIKEREVQLMFEERMLKAGFDKSEVDVKKVRSGWEITLKHVHDISKMPIKSRKVFEAVTKSAFSLPTEAQEVVARLTHNELPFEISHTLQNGHER